MKSHLEFRSPALIEPVEESVSPPGQKIAQLIADALPAHGFTPLAVQPEDWGWRIDLANPAFPLWIGVGAYAEYPDGVLCFIEPSRPYVRRWWRRIPVMAVVDPLAMALELVLVGRHDVHDARWWTEEEVARG